MFVCSAGCGRGSQEILNELGQAEREVATLCKKASGPTSKRSLPAGARQIPAERPFSLRRQRIRRAEIARRIGSKLGCPLGLCFGQTVVAASPRLRPASSAKRPPALEGRIGDRAVDIRKAIDYFAATQSWGYVELLDPKALISKRRLVNDLRILGVEKGMELMVHSSLRNIGGVQGGAQTVVAALLEAIGPRGTLLMPSFNHRAAQVYNPMTTPTTNGAIPDAMWRLPHAERSVHPTHAVAAIGPRAAHYCSEHLDVGIWDAQSPIGKLIHEGGYILALGTTHWTSTAYHVAELSVPCGCIDSFANEDCIVDANGNVRSVRGLAFRQGACPVSIDRLEAALDRRGLQRRGTVGQADAELVRAHDLWKVRRQRLQRVCPGCVIEPNVRPR